MKLALCVTISFGMPTENELYEKWKNAAPEDKDEAVCELFVTVQRHARAVIWIKLRDPNHHVVEDLAHEVAKAALELGRFKEESRFGTWVHAIAVRKCSEELRRRTRARRVFEEFPEWRESAYDDDDPNAIDKRSLEPFAEIEAEATIEKLAEGLSPDDERLLMMVLDGLEQNEIARKLGISSDAAESRRRRLPEKLRKKLGRADG